MGADEEDWMVGGADEKGLGRGRRQMGGGNREQNGGENREQKKGREKGKITKQSQQVHCYQQKFSTEAKKWGNFGGFWGENRASKPENVLPRHS